MPSYSELLAQAKSEIRELDARELEARLDATEPPLVIDVRELDEFEQGAIPGALHVPRGRIESRIEGIAPDRADADRRLLASRHALRVRGSRARRDRLHRTCESLAGGFAGWKSGGLQVGYVPRLLDAERRESGTRATCCSPRSARRGSSKLLDVQGRCCSAPAGSARRGPLPRRSRRRHARDVDADIVDASNLQRQILHATDRIGQPKVDSAADRRSTQLNPDVQVDRAPGAPDLARTSTICSPATTSSSTAPTTSPRATSSTTRASSIGKPVVHASIFRFEGQLTVFRPYEGALLSLPVSRSRRRPSSRRRAPRAACSACSPASWASLQATEAIKLLLGSATTLVGRLLRYDALEMRVPRARAASRSGVPGLRRARPAPIEYIDYEQFCAMPTGALR